MRINDGTDPNHGLRGGEFAKSIRDELEMISNEQFEKLYFACKWHTDKHFNDDITIATCWDADRLDIGRVGVLPDVKFINTEPAKEIVLKFMMR